MNVLRNKIEAIMTGTTRSPVMSLASVLYLISVGYGGIQKLRGAWYRQRSSAPKRLACKVISVGNIAVGGTGKTPMTIYVAERLKHFGYRVAVISRGYKGDAEKTGKVVSDGQTISVNPEVAGDEAYVLACRLRGVPVIVGKKRVDGGLLALNTFNPDVIVLDDAFQHMKLARDIDLVLLDNRQPFGNSHLLPRGILREPLAALVRADAFVLTHSGGIPGPATDRLKTIAPHGAVFTSDHKAYFYRVPSRAKVPLTELSGQLIYNPSGFLTRQRVTAFSGIARNDDFRQTLDNLQCHLTRFLSFPDHHFFADSDFESIVRAAEQTSAEFIITTEKDYARFGHRTTWPLELIVVGVRISFGRDKERFDAFLKERLSR